jgi:hypothetical protein
MKASERRLKAWKDRHLAANPRAVKRQAERISQSLELEANFRDPPQDHREPEPVQVKPPPAASRRRWHWPWEDE